MRTERKAPDVIFWLLLVCILGILLRILIWQSYSPAAYGDTNSYFRVAQALADTGLANMDGARVPGYPAFIVLMNMDPQRIMGAQLILGWLISLIIFLFTWKTAKSAALAALVALAYDFIPAQILSEGNLLSETLSVFLLFLSFLLWLAYTKSRYRALQLLLVFSLGMTVALAGIVRAALFILSAWFALFLFFDPEQPWRTRFVNTAVYALPPLLILGGWLAFMYTSYHVISPDALGGYHQVNHTGLLFESLPDEYAAIRDTYITYRDAQIARRGVQTNAIWDAVPELQQVSGLSFYDLSRTLNKLSWQLIRENPGFYIKSLALGWVNFWKAPVYWMPEQMTSDFLRSFFSILAPVGRAVCMFSNLLFLIGSVMAVFVKQFRQRIHFDRAMLLTGGLVWLFSIVQTFGEHGDNPRFLIPLQMIVLYLVARMVYHYRASILERKQDLYEAL